MSSSPGRYASTVLGVDERTAFWFVGRHPRDAASYDAEQGWILADLESGDIVRTGTVPGRLPDRDGGQPGRTPGRRRGRHRHGDRRRRSLRAVVRSPERPPRRVQWLTFSPDGSRFLSSADDGTVALRDSEDGAVLASTSLAASAARLLPRSSLSARSWSLPGPTTLPSTCGTPAQTTPSSSPARRPGGTDEGGVGRELRRPPLSRDLSGGLSDSVARRPTLPAPWRSCRLRSSSPTGSPSALSRAPSSAVVTAVTPPRRLPTSARW